MQKRRKVPLAILIRRFLGAIILSITITCFFFVHVHVSTSPTDPNNFNEKIHMVSILLLFLIIIHLYSVFFCAIKTKTKKHFLGLVVWCEFVPIVLDTPWSSLTIFVKYQILFLTFYLFFIFYYFSASLNDPIL